MLFNTGFKRHFLHTYPYNFFPAQLTFFCDSLDKTQNLPGSIVEIGCALGQTTVFLNIHMHFRGMEKPYVCIDTFSGFTQEDISYEVVNRSKDQSILKEAFTINNKKWFEETLRSNKRYGTDRVKVFQADINKFDFKEIPQISFCLIDVDLYQPVKAALGRAYPLTTKGGIIIVDDCKQNQVYDGAYRAYIEFIQAHNLPEKIILDKLGIIEV